MADKHSQQQTTTGQPPSSDPTQAEPQTSDLPAPPEELGLSRDARHSTYEQAPEDREAQFPPPGPSVIQTLGKPEEASE